MKVVLTRTLLANPPPVPAGKSKITLTDATCPGLLAEVRATGVVTFYHRYKTRSRQCRMVKLGRYGTDVTLDQARKRSLEMRCRVSAGEDPARLRDQQRAALTVREFVEKEFLPHQQSRKKSWAEDKKLLDKRILPALGSKLLAQVTTADVTRFHDGVVAEGRTPATANRHLACLKTLLAKAVSWGHIGRSPAVGVKLMRENNQRHRYLTQEEIRKLVQALAADPDRVGASLLMLLMLTGARFSEAAAAQWQEVDLENRRWTLPNPKGGRTAFKPLSDAAARLIASLHRHEGNPYLFPGERAGEHRRSVRHTWARVCVAVGLSDFRIHDLRHNFASLLVTHGHSLYTVQTLLNHSSPAMTQRYAHLAPGALVAASNELGRVIAGP